MKSKIYFVVLLLVFSSHQIFCNNISFQSDSTDSELFLWLKAIPGIEFTKIENDSIFTEAYEIIVTQPLDHNNPNGKKFKQQVFLSHIDKSKPMILDTEGYSAFNRTLELSRILGANQLVVEHRFFSESAPDSLEWQYLNIWQAATDHHRIVTLFKDFYNSKWINTGISKGGQTTMYHRRYYPNDVDVSVPYVAPLNFSVEDKRVYEFIDNVSIEDCRKRVNDFQTLVLEKRDDFMPLFIQSSEESNWTYSIGYDAAYEYAVLEYSFAYWQWGDGDCTKIPDSNASIEEIFQHLNINSPFSYIADQGIKSFEPFFYQAFTELGYYAYETEQFGDLIKYVNGSNSIFVPLNVELNFDPTVMQDINNWIQNEGNNFIYIYGEYDPWSSTSVEMTGNTNSIKMILPGGSHRTRIRHFSPEDKEKIYSKLEKWLGLDIQRDWQK